MNKVVEYYLMTKIINLLTVPWVDLPAYKVGIIDEYGKQLKKSNNLKTSTERLAYGVLEKFCFNLRRLIEKLPGGKSILLKYFTVYSLFKEERNIDSLDEKFESLLQPLKYGIDKGKYTINHPTYDSLGNLVRQGDKVMCLENQLPKETFFGSHLYEVISENTKGRILVSYEDISPT